MKIKSNKKSFAFTGIILFFISIFSNSCQKETSIDTKQSQPLSSTASVNSSIIYTNVNPDSTTTCTGGLTSQTIQKVYSLDLNKDGIADFILLVQYQRLNRYTQGYANFVRASSAVGSSNQGHC